MDNRPIGVFDSGIGGLTAVRELAAILPEEDIVYLGDTARVPYGSRSKETILKYSMQDIRFLLGQDVKMIICACGTVSTTLPDSMTRNLPVPYTGVVVHAAQAACALSQGGRIGVIGTTAAIRTGQYGKVIRSIRPDVRVLGNSCPLFVPLVEGGLIERDNQITRLAAQMYLKPLMEQKIDTLILGCTHYPVIYDIISDVTNFEVTLIDPGRETARYAKSFLMENNLLSDRSEPGRLRFYVTDSVENFTEVAEKYMKIRMKGDVSQVDLEGYDTAPIV